MKRKIFLVHILLFFLVSAIFSIWIILLIFFINENKGLSYKQQLTINVISSISILFIYLAWILIYIYRYKEKHKNLKESFNYYVENKISDFGVGVIIFNNSDEIIWVSNFIKKWFGTNTTGKKLNYISKNFAINIKNNEKKFKFEHKNFTFLVIADIKNKFLMLKDATKEEKILNKYYAEKMVIGEIEIDNFQQLQNSLSDENIFSMQNKVVKTLDKLSEKLNFIYHQYVNGKYVFFTNIETLNELIDEEFDFIKEIGNKKIEDNYLSVSIGIGFGTKNQKNLQELARDALKQSHSRGGNQITLMEYNKKPIYYGSKFELGQSKSRVKIRKIAKLFEDKLKNKNIKNVIVYGHKIADLDVIGAAIGIKNICAAYGKKTYIGNITFDTTTEKFIKEQYLKKDFLDIFIKAQHATKITSKDTIIVIVDTSETDRIENKKAFEKVKKDNIFIFDHHRIKNKTKDILQQNIYIDTNASSTCEIIVEIISFTTHNIKLDKLSAQMLLNGIFLDTAIFTKSVSARTYTAASFLENRGADSTIASNILKIPEEAYLYIKKILENLQEIKPGYFLATYEKVVPDDYISMTADEILRTKERVASFVIAKSAKDKNLYKMSARGIDTNVQKIAEQVGGGGHFSSAAALSNEPLSVFTDNLIQAIMSDKKEK